MWNRCAVIFGSRQAALALTSAPKYLIQQSPTVHGIAGTFPFTVECAGTPQALLMATFPLFSKRQKQLRGEDSDVYVYDVISKPLRIQIVHIWRDTLGGLNDYELGEYVRTKEAYSFIVKTLRREYGTFKLSNPRFSRDIDELEQFLLEEEDVEKILDAVELSCKVIDLYSRDYEYLRRQNANARADAAIAELNERFREHGVGYQFVCGEIIRVDSELLHAEVVKPALALLHGEEYAGAQAEYLTAHEHYRHGRAKEALVEALKAFESVMKVICAKRGWPHDPGATASKLLQVLFEKELIPAYWQTHFAGVRSALESGVPTVRNKMGGHGQGTEVTEVPQHIVAFALYSTASAVLLLAQAEAAYRD